jgi:uncharacterized membrane protein
MPNEDTPNDRLALIEARLSRIESKLALPKINKSTRIAEPSTITTPSASPPHHSSMPSITSLMGWGGATALVMAAAYLIRLAVDSGWLTPERQVGLAITGGIALIAAGLMLRHVNRQYASLLPAGGIVTLFLASYGAHMYYGLISPLVATASVAAICAIALWLCRIFASELYAIFAVVGSYSAPLLISNVLVDVTDMAIYFSAWSIIFGIFSVWVGQRFVYLLAAYCALLVFDFIHRSSMQSEWTAAVVFQTLQFCIFLIAITIYSIRHRQPMTKEEAVIHLPALLIFYFLQYSVLNTNIPALAPWIALLTAAAVAGAHFISQHLLRRPLPGSRFLLSAYLALVLFHAGYLESVPDAWKPWVAFVLAPAVALYSLGRTQGARPEWPVWLGIGVITVANYLRAVFDSDLAQVPAGDALALFYALELYAGYWLVHQRVEMKNLYVPLLYAGHVSAMAAAVHLLDDRLSSSAVWGVLAVGCLVIAIRSHERILGQSSLLIFTVFAGKVLLYDLHTAVPLVRIGILLVLGLSLYAGGWLYQRMLISETSS